MSHTRKIYWISDAGQIKALASVVRQEIVDAVTAAGPCTIATVAATLGMKPDRLYFHIRRLLKLGLLLPVGNNGSGREEARLYDVPGRPLRLRGSPSGKAPQRSLGEIHDGIVRLARRDIRRAVGRADLSSDGPTREFWVGRQRGWLTASEIRRLNKLIEEAMKLVRDGRPRKGARPIAFTFVLAPPKHTTNSKTSNGDKS